MIKNEKWPVLLHLATLIDNLFPIRSVSVVFCVMKVHEAFALQHLNDVLRNTFSLSDESRLEYSLNTYSGFESAKVLNVAREDVLQQYVLVKVLNYSNADLQQYGNYASVIQPVFIVENHQNEIYGAFEKKRIDNFAPPRQNNLDHLKAILKTLAQFQAIILDTKEDNEGKSEYALKDITDNLISLECFKSIEESKITGTLEELQAAFNILLKSHLLVNSIWSSLASNVYVNEDSTESLFLELTAQQLLLPPAYDAILYIFSLSNEKFRQKHFDYLIAYYFKSLVDALYQQNSKISEKISRTYAEVQIKTVLPIAKFNIAADLAKTNPSPRFEEIVVNILNYLKFPIINQEDVYQATRNKLSFDDYVLDSYALVPLDEKNGHLGEYFHLQISVIREGKMEKLILFVKYLIANTEMLQTIIESGVGKKEDFFYSILLPLYRDHGLESILDFAPKCYLTRINGFLVLENLGIIGYTGLKPNVDLNYDGLRMILGKLAKFHASSLIVEEILSKQSDKEIRLGEEFAEYLMDTIFRPDDSYDKKWFDSVLHGIYYIINKCPDLTENLDIPVDKVNTKLQAIFYSIPSKIKKSDTMRNVINHGDMYVSNMMIKFGKEETVEDGVLIDFQLLRYMPPAYEVLFFIFVNSTKEIRDKYLMTLLDLYYDNFSSHLKHFNLNPEEIFSRKQFYDDVNFAKPASLAMAFSYGYVTKIDSDFREEILHDQEKSKYYLEDNVEEFIDLSLKQRYYRTAIKGLIKDLTDLIKNDD